MVAFVYLLFKKPSQLCICRYMKGNFGGHKINFLFHLVHIYSDPDQNPNQDQNPNLDPIPDANLNPDQNLNPEKMQNLGLNQNDSPHC